MSECIVWGGALNSGGYPVTWANGKTVYKHRLIAGASPKEVVLHTCDNPACVNPEHLVIGTHKDNSQDMVNKGRSAKGEDCPSAVLNEEQVHEIRSYQGFLPSRKVAVKFNISKTNVLDIWNKRIWRHI